MCQLSGTVLHVEQESIKKQTEIILSAHFLHGHFELKSARSVLTALENCYTNAVGLSTWAIYEVWLSA